MSAPATMRLSDLTASDAGQLANLAPRETQKLPPARHLTARSAACAKPHAKMPDCRVLGGERKVGFGIKFSVLPL